MAAIQFEREELLDEMNDSPRGGGQGPLRCGYAQTCINRFKEENDTVGDSLMSFLEEAEAIGEAHNAEGYYLRTANRLQKVSGCRTRMFDAFNDLVAHHQRTGPMDNERVELARLRSLLDSNDRHIQELHVREQRARDKLSEALSRCETMKECLEAQFKSRYANKEAELQRKLREKDEKIRQQDEVISSDQILIGTLRTDLNKAEKQAKTSKSLIGWLNKRVREEVKAARLCVCANKARKSEQKCHILGTYDDVLGVPV